MFIIYSRHGYKLGSFDTIDAAMDALNRWFDSLYILSGGRIIFDKRDKMQHT